jgi:hypothetical protein
MVYCPYCGRWFKNKQALRAHLKHCPLKNNTKAIETKTKKEEIRTWKCKYLGYIWVITGTQTAINIIQRIMSIYIKNDKAFKNIEKIWAIIGALTALRDRDIAIIKDWDIKPIKQQLQTQT